MATTVYKVVNPAMVSGAEPGDAITAVVEDIELLGGNDFDDPESLVAVWLRITSVEVS